MVEKNKAEEQLDEIIEKQQENAAETEEVSDDLPEEEIEIEADTEEVLEENNSSNAEDNEPKKGLFGKVKKEKKDKKDIQIEELTDKYKRTMAEFDNFRKRTDKEKTQMYEIGAKEVIQKILPIIDNFERGLSSLTDEEKTAPFTDGMDKIYKQFTKTLEELGVKPIEAVGSEFNPDFHNAVMQGEDEELDANIVAEEYQKGYVYRDVVVRHSMVKVVNC